MRESNPTSVKDCWAPIASADVCPRTVAAVVRTRVRRWLCCSVGWVVRLVRGVVVVVAVVRGGGGGGGGEVARTVGRVVGLVVRRVRVLRWAGMGLVSGVVRAVSKAVRPSWLVRG
ncbi:hypothetical protein [Kitasatospora sp. Ki12]